MKGINIRILYNIDDYYVSNEGTSQNLFYIPFYMSGAVR
jgi:hypothetical protein